MRYKKQNKWNQTPASAHCDYSHTSKLKLLKSILSGSAAHNYSLFAFLKLLMTVHLLLIFGLVYSYQPKLKNQKSFGIGSKLTEVQIIAGSIAKRRTNKKWGANQLNPHLFRAKANVALQLAGDDGVLHIIMPHPELHTVIQKIRNTKVLQSTDCRKQRDCTSPQTLQFSCSNKIFIWALMTALLTHIEDLHVSLFACLKLC